MVMYSNSSLFVFLFMHILNPMYICKLILFIVNNVCYFDLDVV
jgi:hypothetical protein